MHSRLGTRDLLDKSEFEKKGSPSERLTRVKEKGGGERGKKRKKRGRNCEVDCYLLGGAKLFRGLGEDLATLKEERSQKKGGKRR